MKHSTFIKIGHILAQESKCISKKVGVVIVKDDRIISTGYNGSPKGQLNCCDKFDPLIRPDVWGRPVLGENELVPHLSKVGRDEHHQWSNTHEIHAELNAIVYAAKSGISIDGATMYCTLTPCANCAKVITQSGIKRIIYDQSYDKNQDDWDKILQNAEIEVLHISEV